ncbi:MAG: hypothetical protein SVS15_06060 [Thermodesulfobacteriota bacterium]|nr:hypothetical protein [Thermodesulfobacteriota bacterium]
MIPDRRETALKSSRGYTQSELVAAVFVVFLLILGVLYVATPGEDSGAGDAGVPVYRWANAMYAHNALERYRIAVMNYYDMHGQLPGDSSTDARNSTGGIIGNNNGRVEREIEENVKFFKDLYASGVTVSETIRIRGGILDFYWMKLYANSTLAGEGNFFKLPGFNRAEARALDYKFDDGWNDSGDIISSLNDNGTVDLYVKFIMY